MVQTTQINVEVIKNKFGVRPETEDITTYVKRMVKELEKEYGFTQFHQDINKIIKRIVMVKEYEFVASKITENEGQWLVAISRFLEEHNV